CFSLAIDNARLYREAREAVAMREDFMSVAAHELRSPLTALQLSVASLERAQRARGDPQMLAPLAVISSQTSRLCALSETMLDVMQVAAGRIPLLFGDFDLRQLVANAAD